MSNSTLSIFKYNVVYLDSDPTHHQHSIHERDCLMAMTTTLRRFNQEFTILHSFNLDIS